MAGRAFKLIRSCFAYGGHGDDDTQQIVNDRVPPLGGPAVLPSHARAAARQDDSNLRAMRDDLEEQFQRRFEAVENQVANLNAKCDKQTSQIASLNAQLQYREPSREPLVVVYPPGYRSEDQEATPRFSD